jgi:hypothetical protein
MRSDECLNEYGMDRLTILHKIIYSKQSQMLTSVIWK